MWCSSVDAFADAVQFDLPPYEQILYEAQEMTRATSKPVHFYYDYMLHLAPFTPTYEFT